jgi:uncharacterized membrane protein YjgN (DUF898 family)
MENFTPANELAFRGKGSAYFEIQLANWVLTFITFGFYYPWAKANALRYLYQKTEFAGSRFTFHGTGKEMFIGFLKGLLLLGVLGGILLGGVLSGKPQGAVLGLIGFYLGLAAVLPLAIHGRMRYRMSRSSWRGIHFGYRGQLGKLYWLCFTNFLFTLLTLGFYGAWFTVNLRQEIIGNIRLGSVKFAFTGTGTELFMIHLKGYLLTLLTAGVYGFAYLSQLHNYYIDNILIEQNGQYSRLEANTTGWAYFKLLAVNLLILVGTLGIGAPFVTVRTLRFVLANAELIGDFNGDDLLQTEQAYRDATLEDVSDMLDLSIV